MDRTEKGRDATGFDPCPGCGHPDNPPENSFCGRCGASLERLPARSGELAPRPKGDRARLGERFLPGRLGPVGRTVAAGLAVAAVDVGLAWLRQRLEKTEQPVLPHDAGRVRRREEAGDNPEHLHGSILREAGLLLRDGRETRGWFASEIKIRSTRPER